MIYNNAGYEDSKRDLVQHYNDEIARIKQASQSLMVKGWVPKTTIQAGQTIQDADLTPVELPKDSIPDNFVGSKENITGSSAKVVLNANTLITESLLYREAPTPRDLRNREMSFVQLPVALQQGDAIDIRIQFPTGEDYILLSKKKVLSLTDSMLTVTLDEHEILSLSSAIVDAYLHKASIYALTYVEPGLQNGAIPTYPANDQVMKLIARDPNIVKQAETFLNKSSRELLEKGLTAMSPQRSLDFARSQAAAAAASARPASIDELAGDSETAEDANGDGHE